RAGTRPAPRHVAERQHGRHRGAPAATRPEPDVPAVTHVQLPDLVHAGDVRHVRGEGDSARRRVAHEAEPAGDYRAQPIGTHHKTAVTRDTLPVTRACDDAGDTPVLPHQVLYPHGLAAPRTRPPP